MDPDAVKEYQKIDDSVIEIVDKAIAELEYRADEVGKPLGNLSVTKLAGCKEIKLREAGIRIVFKVTNETIDILRITYILAIEKRSKDMVFKLADKRYKGLKRMDKHNLREYLQQRMRWTDMNKDE